MTLEIVFEKTYLFSQTQKSSLRATVDIMQLLSQAVMKLNGTQRIKLNLICKMDVSAPLKT